MGGISDTTLQLSSGARIPQLGLGVWKAASGETTRNAVLAALRFGYRHVDTARIYGNEADVGAAVKAIGIPRDQIFVTTKLWNEDQGYDQALRAFDASLKRLGLDYIDLYLLHWPVAGKRLDSWRAPVRREAGPVHRRQQFPRASSRGAAATRQARARGESDRADAVPAATRDAGILQAAGDRRRGVQPAHPRSASRSSRRGRHRSSNRTLGRPGPAAVGATAWSGRDTEVDEGGSNRGERFAVRLRSRRTRNAGARFSRRGACHRLGSRRASVTEGDRFMPPLEPGTPAPDFTLPCTPDQKVSLTEFRGRPVVLVFYPADWSPVCGDQLALYNELREDFAAFDATVLATTCDSRSWPATDRRAPTRRLPAAPRARDDSVCALSPADASGPRFRARFSAMETRDLMQSLQAAEIVLGF